MQSPTGDVLVLTKTRFYFFFHRPRTYVTPRGISLGFCAVYNTSDAKILSEFHEFFCGMVLVGGFKPLLMGAKIGFIDFPPDSEHLKQFIVGFHA